MAGEWIKLELSTSDKPEVLKIARLTSLDKDAVLGKLIRLWAWFDRNSVDGHVDGIVDADVDYIVGHNGFISALKLVGWSDYDNIESWVKLTNFDRHNGETAKQRALKNIRQAKWRLNKDENVDASTSTKATQSRLPEKRREENINTSKGSRLSNGWILPNEWINEAQKINSVLTVKQINYIAEGFKDYWIGLSGARAVKADWLATWRNWIRKQETPKQENKEKKDEYL